MLASTRRTTRNTIPISLMKPSRSRLLTALLLSFTIFGLTASALAAPKLEVKIIEAKRGSASIDAPLQSMGQALKKSFPSFKTFKLISEHSYTSKPGEMHALQIRPKLKVKLRVSERSGGVMLTTTVKRKGKTKRKKGKTKAQYGELFFQAFKWRDNALILAVIARK